MPEHVYVRCQFCIRFIGAFSVEALAAPKKFHSERNLQSTKLSDTTKKQLTLYFHRDFLRFFFLDRDFIFGLLFFKTAVMWCG